MPPDDGAQTNTVTHTHHRTGGPSRRPWEPLHQRCPPPTRTDPSAHVHATSHILSTPPDHPMMHGTLLACAHTQPHPRSGVPPRKEGGWEQREEGEREARGERRGDRRGTPEPRGAKSAVPAAPTHARSPHPRPRRLNPTCPTPSQEPPSPRPSPTQCRNGPPAQATEDSERHATEDPTDNTTTRSPPPVARLSSHRVPAHRQHAPETNSHQPLDHHAQATHNCTPLVAARQPHHRSNAQLKDQGPPQKHQRDTREDPPSAAANPPGPQHTLRNND